MLSLSSLDVHAPKGSVWRRSMEGTFHILCCAAFVATKAQAEGQTPVQLNLGTGQMGNSRETKPEGCNSLSYL